MATVTASQIRAARGLLNWSQDNLADAARVGRTTVQNVESGFGVRHRFMNSICRALQDEGVEFLPSNGVRQRTQGLTDYTGPESCELFFESVVRTVKSKGGPLVCSIDSEAMLLRASGFKRQNNLTRLEHVQKIAEVKCLLTIGMKKAFSPSFAMRLALSEQVAIPASYFAYAGHIAFSYFDASMQFVFVVFENEKFARHAQTYFLSRWEKAKPLDARDLRRDKDF